MKEEKINLEQMKTLTNNKKGHMTTMAIAAIIIGTAGFLGGTKYQNYKISKTRANFANGQFFRQGTGGPNGLNGQNRQSGNGRVTGGGIMAGEIISIDEKSITVKMQDESTKIVILGNTTTYSKSETGSKNDLKTGGKVGIFGTNNSDGSVTAQNIQLNPEFRIFGQESSPVPTK